ncbi:hypothetical protein [Methylosinus sp. KRF6]|uniref:DUF7336 domain-containing protein n=1 Tax=Methylosinus sp. KRF6 TaxID=2846853 RepID=UPI001C0AAED9|nr:hypothetical protein [Methylosinus sp. KRF6]MBU3890982.1 hypothetical protein [Methylosinus sp. KRF6]
MDVVYVLFHVFEPLDLSCDDIDERAKFIGVYRTEADAKAAIQRLRDKPGFCDYPEGFEISRCPLNKDNWPKGFITV